MADEERRLGDWLLASRHTCIHAVPPTSLNTAVRVEFMARHVQSTLTAHRREMKQVKLLTRFRTGYGCYLPIAIMSMCDAVR